MGFDWEKVETGSLIKTDGDIYGYRGDCWRKLMRVSKKGFCGDVLECDARDWPRTYWLINCESGLIDARTTRWHTHDPSYGSRFQVPIGYIPDYEPGGKCEAWTEFLQAVFRGDSARIALLQAYLGYLLLPTCRWEKALVLQDPDGWATEVIIRMARLILGEENTCELEGRALGSPFRRRELQHKALILSNTENFPLELGKRIISGDMIDAEQKYGRRILFHNTAKFLCLEKGAPDFAGQIGLARKFITLQMSAPETPQADTFAMLENEAPGVFNWMVQGAINLVEADGFRKFTDAVGA